LDWSALNFSNTNTTLPAINIKETDNEYEIEVAAPGMKKTDFKINLDKGQLFISSEKKEEKADKESGNYTRREFSYQSFQRSFAIPENLVDGEKITARYDDGILRVKTTEKGRS
jgi:HSP20 family protein